MRTLYSLLIPILVTIFFVFLEKNNISGDTLSKKNISISLEKFDMLPIQNIRIKDTVFVLGNSFIEILLKTQRCRLYIRDSSNYIEYKISTGNPHIFEGLATPTGLYTVQNKTPLGISRQFNDAELHNWIGFNVNFGIHGLAGNGYYGHLGVRPSSHGCVRISREDGKALYSKVKLGTPVLVYSEEPAIMLKFIDTTKDISNYLLLPSDARTFAAEIKQRQQNIYDSIAYINKKKLLIDSETIIRWGGYRIGYAKNIPYKQKAKNPTLDTFLLTDRLSRINILDRVIELENDTDTTSIIKKDNK